MNRKTLDKLENNVQLLLKSYEGLKAENVELHQNLETSRELLTQSQEQLTRSRKLIDDLKLQLDNAYKRSKSNNSPNQDIEKIQERVQKLITEVDGCIKSLE